MKQAEVKVKVQGGSVKQSLALDLSLSLNLH